VELGGVTKVLPSQSSKWLFKVGCIPSTTRDGARLLLRSSGQDVGDKLIPIEQVYDLANVRQAYQATSQGKVKGKAVVVLD